MKYLAVILAFILMLSLPMILAGCAKDDFEIRLAGNVTTGSTWQYTMSDEQIVEEISNDYEEDGAYGTNEVPAVGRGGVFVFAFRPVGEGDVTLEFTYGQAWEPENIYRTATYVLHSDGKEITVVSSEEHDLMAETVEESTEEPVGEPAQFGG